MDLSPEQLVLVAIADLKPHPRNDGTHPPAQLDHLKASLTQHGLYRNVVIAEDGTLLAGHGVVQAAQQLGYTHVRAERRPYGPDDPRAIQILLGDNHIARLREQDDRMLAELLQGLAAEDPAALLGTGYDAESLAALVTAQELGTGTDGGEAGRDVEPQIDRAEELREQWDVDVGQLWGLGPHRVICGDCTDKAIVEQLLRQDSVAGVITDPPYAFGLASHSQFATKAGGWHDMMNNASWFRDLYRSWQGRIVDGPLWVFTNWRTLPILMRATYDADCGMNSVMVWYKDWIATGGMKGLRPTYELIAFTALGAYVIPNRGIEDFINVGWSSYKPTGHNAEKPVALLEHLVTVSDIACVYDPFLGSGTTLMACTNLGKTCYGCEIDPGYVAVTLERWSQLTGISPTRIA